MILVAVWFVVGSHTHRFTGLLPHTTPPSHTLHGSYLYLQFIYLPHTHFWRFGRLIWTRYGYCCSPCYYVGWVYVRCHVPRLITTPHLYRFTLVTVPPPPPSPHADIGSLFGWFAFCGPYGSFPDVYLPTVYLPRSLRTHHTHHGCSYGSFPTHGSPATFWITFSPHTHTHYHHHTFPFAVRFGSTTTTHHPTTLRSFPPFWFFLLGLL